MATPTHEKRLTSEQQSLLQTLRANYPWLVDIGLDTFVVDQIRNGSSIDEIVAALRQTPQYQRMFPGMLRDDGSRRFATEAEYLATVDQYRDVLMDFGVYDPNEDDPAVWANFMDSGIQPDELTRRFQVYRSLERGSQDIRDAFYVYAGMDVSVDDLYRAVTSHDRRAELVETYESTVAGEDLDYSKFIKRATEAGIRRVVENVGTEKGGKTGRVTAPGEAGPSLGTGKLEGREVTKEIINRSPREMQELVSAVWVNANAQGRTLSLDELLATFEYAMIGSAAAAHGFELPDQQRLQAFINAGVDRARALRGYSEAALRQAGLGSIAERFNTRRRIGQGLLEDAFVAGDAGAQAAITRLYRQEASLGQAGTGFNRQVEAGRVIQQGRIRR